MTIHGDLGIQLTRTARERTCVISSLCDSTNSASWSFLRKSQNDIFALSPVSSPPAASMEKLELTSKERSGDCAFSTCAGKPCVRRSQIAKLPSFEAEMREFSPYTFICE